MYLFFLLAFWNFEAFSIKDTSTLASRCDRKSLFFIRILPINQPRSKSWRLKKNYRDRHEDVNSERLRPCELQNQTLDEDDPWTSFLPATPWEIRRTTQTSLQAKPKKLVLGQDMLINIQFKEGWALINAQNQSFTEKQLNAKRRWPNSNWWYKHQTKARCTTSLTVWNNGNLY